MTYEQRTISEVLSDILDRSGYEEMLRTTGNQERLDNLAELKQAVYDYEISCGEKLCYLIILIILPYLRIVTLLMILTK